MKKVTTAILILLGLGWSFVNAQSGKGGQTGSLEEAKKAIAASNAIYFESFAKNDPSIFVNRYAKDACILAPNAPAMCGPEAAAQFFKTACDQFGLKNGKFITTAVYGDGKEYVTEEGLWQS